MFVVDDSGDDEDFTRLDIETTTTFVWRRAKVLRQGEAALSELHSPAIVRGGVEHSASSRKNALRVRGFRQNGSVRSNRRPPTLSDDDGDDNDTMTATTATKAHQILFVQRRDQLHDTTRRKNDVKGDDDDDDMRCRPSNFSINAS